MLKKRIIPCLDIKNGRTVKGIQFEDIRDSGDPIELAKRYVSEGADELVFLDISATNERRQTLIPLVEQIAHEITIPFTVGGGIQSLDDARRVIGAGADKISINSAAVARPELITEIAQSFGSQCVVVAIDGQLIGNEWFVFTHGGRQKTNLTVLEWAKMVETYGAGELLLTSMTHDGTKAGFALHITDQVSISVNLPVIASGGAGTKADFAQLFTTTNASAGLAASIFHTNEIAIPALKNYLKKQQIPIR